MKLIISILIFLAFSLGAAETMDVLVEKLASEDFDIREKATKELGNYPEEFAQKFLAMASKSNDAEVSYRLRSAARLIFSQIILGKDDSWLLMHGSLRLEGRAISIIVTADKNDEQEQNYGYAQHTREIGFIVDFIFNDSPASNLKQADIIEEIIEDADGIKTKQEITKLRAGREYILKVRRYKDTMKMFLESNNYYIDAENKDYETLELKVKTGWKSDKELNVNDEYALAEKLWKEFSDKNDDIDNSKK